MPNEVTFTDVHGVRWNVFEVPTSTIEFADRIIDATPAHLTFETVIGSRTVVKRLRSYPDDWRDLDDAELEDLCTRAGPVVGATPDDEATRRSVERTST